MTWPIGDEFYQVFTRMMGRDKIVEQLAYLAHHIDITLFISTSNVVGLTETPSLSDDVQRSRVVFDE